MTYCQECGSEVAENDIYCPFCGISLKPIADPGASALDEFASTIAMPELAVKPAASTDPKTETEINEPETLDAASSPDPGVPSAAVASDEQDTEEYPIAPDTNEKVGEIVSSEDLPVEAEKVGLTREDVEPSAEPVAEIHHVAAIPAPSMLASAIHDETAEEKAAEPPETAESGASADEVVIEEVDLAGSLELVPEGPVESAEPISSAQETEPEPAIAPPEEPLVPGQEPNGLATVLADEVPEAKKSTASGDIERDAGQSYTTPNIGGDGTDGRRSGLKPLSEGTLLAGRYKISKKIGGGGMGAVYLATDMNLGSTQRAVKEMVQSHIEEEQQAKAIEDFKRESMILTSLDHPSIPTIYDYFYDEAECRFYLVMKYISGGDLASRLRSAPEGRIDEKTVTEWALQIIDVLDYLHTLPTTIVYRDLKPSNVMIDGNTGRIMLIDFGIARSINQTQEKGVTAVGTMGYAPPELFSGQVEPRSDIYSLGSTMFHLLTGADPQNNPLLIFDFQKNPRPRQINPRLSDQIEKILMKSVEYNADARFSSAAEMKIALQGHLERLRTGNLTYGVSESPAAVSLAFQTVFCGFCGQRIVATDLFCAFCGSKQPIAQHGVHSEIYSRTAVTAKLVIDGTSELDTPAYSLEKSENLVGRRDPMSNIFPEVDLSKYDPQTKISRRHARIWRDGRDFMVEDLGSSNGTLLLTRASEALRLLPHQPHSLSNGDRLRIGDTTLQFIVS